MHVRFFTVAVARRVDPSGTIHHLILDHGDPSTGRKGKTGLATGNDTIPLARMALDPHESLAIKRQKRLNAEDAIELFLLPEAQDYRHPRVLIKMELRRLKQFWPTQRRFGGY